jgi:hypothetical protein
MKEFPEFIKVFPLNWPITLSGISIYMFQVHHYTMKKLVSTVDSTCFVIMFACRNPIAIIENKTTNSMQLSPS